MGFWDFDWWFPTFDPSVITKTITGTSRDDKLIGTSSDIRIWGIGDIVESDITYL